MQYKNYWLCFNHTSKSGLQLTASSGYMPFTSTKIQLMPPSLLPLKIKVHLLLAEKLGNYCTYKSILLVSKLLITLYIRTVLNVHSLVSKVF